MSDCLASIISAHAARCGASKLSGIRLSVRASVHLDKKFHKKPNILIGEEEDRFMACILRFTIVFFVSLPEIVYIHLILVSGTFYLSRARSRRISTRFIAPAGRIGR